MPKSDIQNLERIIPSLIDFYDGARIEKILTTDEKELRSKVDNENRVFVGFRIYGEGTDLDAMMIVAFAEDLDESLFSEVGNILASRLVSELHYDRPIMPSEPRRLSSSERELFFKAADQLAEIRFELKSANQALPFAVYLLTQEPRTSVDV